MRATDFPTDTIRYTREKAPKGQAKSRMISNALIQVLTAVNGPYGTEVSAHQLAAMIVDSASATNFNAAVFAFFSEVPLRLQKEFMWAMDVDEELASRVADQVSQISGYALPLVG